MFTFSGIQKELLAQSVEPYWIVKIAFTSCKHPLIARDLP